MVILRRPNYLILILALAAAFCAVSCESKPKKAAAPRQQPSAAEITILPSAEAPDRARPKSYATAQSVKSAVTLMPEEAPLPMKGFAKGTIIAIGDDSGKPGTYRLAFRYSIQGQLFPLLECAMLEAFEKRLAELGPGARHGEVEVQVKGYVTQYRGTNFLLLHDFRVPKGKYPGGGVPATKEGLSVPGAQ